MGFVAITAGISAEDVRDLMTATVEHRFGRLNRLLSSIDRPTNNGSCYTARETRRFVREINLKPRTSPIESPQSNGWPRRSCAPCNGTMSALPNSLTP